MKNHKTPTLHRYNWTGIDSNGHKISGSIEQENFQSAKHNLQKQELTLLTLRKSYAEINFVKKNKLTDKQKLDFLEELTWLLQSGVSLADGLYLIADSHHHTTMKKWMLLLRDQLIAGSAFSEALASTPPYFSKIDCQLIAAGEKSGQLDQVLKQIIQYQTQKIEMKRKIIKAMSYPLTLLLIAIGITTGLMISMIPQFEKIYQNFNAPLPYATRLLIQISTLLSQHAIIILIIFLFTPFILFFSWEKLSAFQHKISQCVLKIPLLRQWIVIQCISQWSQIFSTTLSSGIAIVEALHISNQTITHPLFRIEMEKVEKDVMAGQSLSSALSQSTFFPMRAKQLISISEQADSLSTVMEKIAILYRELLNQSVDHLSKLLEPVIMVVIATLIAGLIIAMYLPIFRMGNII